MEHPEFRHYRLGQFRYVTVCYLDGMRDTVIGVAFCAPSDQFCRARGRTIAYGRASQFFDGLQRPGRLFQKQRGIQQPALAMLLEHVGWHMVVEHGRVFSRPVPFRLPAPHDPPLSADTTALLRGSFTGEIGKSEGVRWVSISSPFDTR